MAGLWEQPERDSTVQLSELWTAGEALEELARLYPQTDHATARVIESHLRAAHKAALLAFEEERERERASLHVVQA